MIACVTTGSSSESCAHNGREGDTELLLWSLLYPFRYIGFDVLRPIILNGVGGVDVREGIRDGTSLLDEYEQNWKEALQGIKGRPIVTYNRDADFDDSQRLIANAPVYSPFIRHRVKPSWG